MVNNSINKRYWICMPVRKIPKNFRNVTGIAAHLKAAGPAGFESTLERDFLTLLEFSPEVEGFEVQPVMVEWSEGEKRHQYTPDVLVQYTAASGKPTTLFEVKYRSDLKQDWKHLKPRLLRAITYAKSRGWRFKIASEVEIRTPFLENAKFLLRFVRQGPVSEAHMDLIDQALQRAGPMPINSLLEAIFSNEWNRASLLPTLWYLIGTFQIGCDLGKPLTMASQAWYLP